MNPATAQRLLDLNRQFYQTFAADFSATRRRLQPGVRRLLPEIPPGARLLDLGCGNGELWRELAETRPPGLYLGLDFSPGLLETAAEPGSAENGPAVFLQFDLSDPDWGLIEGQAPFDLALAFAVLHHLPGRELRVQALRRLHACLPLGGRFFHSNWQFLNSERLRRRIQPWESIGLDGQVDPGDYLLDWRSGGYGLRYVHHYSAAELADLAEETGFAVKSTFYSDGDSGSGSIYQVWESVIQV